MSSNNDRKKAVIIRALVKHSLKPVMPIAIQAMNEQQLIHLILSFPGDTSWRDAVEAYEALRRIDMVRYPEVNYELEARRMGLDKVEMPDYWDRPENQGDPAGTV
jgi:hypothetical protein